MTYVTTARSLVEVRSGVNVACPLSASFGVGQLSLERLQVADYDPPAVDLNRALSLEPAETARDELTHRADLGRDLLLICGKSDLDTSRYAGPLASKTNEQRRQPVPHGAEGEFLDDGYQAAQSCADDAKRFQGNCRMFQAKKPKVFLAHEQEC